MSSFFPGVEIKRNHRKHPGVKGKRPDRKAIKRREAAERDAAYHALTIEQKQARNPNKY